MQIGASSAFNRMSSQFFLFASGPVSVGRPVFLSVMGRRGAGGPGQTAAYVGQPVDAGRLPTGLSPAHPLEWRAELVTAEGR